MPNSSEHETFSANKSEIVGIFMYITSAVISKEEFAVVSHLRFIRTNFMLSWVELENCFIVEDGGQVKVDPFTEGMLQNESDTVQILEGWLEVKVSKY